MTDTVFILFYINNLVTDCDGVPVTPNGVAITPSGRQVGDLAIFECNTGYGLVGNAEVPCGPSGLWGTVPVCRLGVYSV